MSKRKAKKLKLSKGKPADLLGYQFPPGRGKSASLDDKGPWVTPRSFSIIDELLERTDGTYIPHPGDNKLEATVRGYHVEPDTFAALIVQLGLVGAAQFVERHNALHNWWATFHKQERKLRNKESKA